MPEPRETNVKPRARRAGLWALLALALAYATVMQASGWAQTANFALVRALSDGTAQIDRWQWETRDKSYYDGHFYSVKAPGMPALTVPFYKLATAMGAQGAAFEVAQRAKRSEAFRWYKAGVPSLEYGNTIAHGRLVRAEIENGTPLMWLLGLVGAVLPALAMLLMVRWCVERLEPGLGTLAAVLLGAGTLVMPFATLFFSHVLAAALAFAAFALLWRERAGPPRLALVAAAGLAAGLAVTTEYPLALAGAIVGLYALARGDVARRGVTYAGGVLAGVMPLLAYNLWAFGSVTHFSYENAVAEPGVTGHDVLGLNEGGFFGIGLPHFENAFDLLLSNKGLLIVSPVLAMSLAGLVLMRRRGNRAEAYTIAGVFAAFLIYNSGYWLPFGGGSPGPRFLIPALPFLAVALAPALRRWPTTTLALAVPSVLTMATATVTVPMIGNGDVGLWVNGLILGNFEHTVATALGAGNGWLGLAPFLLALAAALALTARATAGAGLDLSRDAGLGAVAICAWAVLAEVVPDAPVAAAGPGHDFTPLVIVATAIALAIVVAGAITRRTSPHRWVARASETG